MATSTAWIPRRAFLLACSGAGAALLLSRDALPPRRAGTRGHLQAELELAAEKAALCSSANVAGVGLRGEYFAEEGCGGAPLLVRQDGTVDFDDSLDWPAQQNDRRPRSVRWSGWVKAPLPGRYRFHAGVARAAVKVSREPVAGPGADASAAVELAAGRFYPISIVLNRLEPGEGRIRLEWTAPHGARFVVPRALLYLPTA
jgi:hypothetical protein